MRWAKRTLIFLGFLALLWSIAAVVLDWYGKGKTPEGSWEAIVLAGCEVEPDGTPSNALRRRTERAAELWHNGFAPVIVISGGGNEGRSAAEVAADFARDLAIPDTALLLETLATSTWENALFTSEAFPYRRIIVVTDTYHAFRAGRVFRRYFDEVEVATSRSGFSSRVRGALREVLAVAYYAVLGRL